MTETAETIQPPFGGVSLSELRRRGAADRSTMAMMRAALPGWDKPRNPVQLGFDALIAGDTGSFEETSSFEYAVHLEHDDHEQPDATPRTTRRLAFILAIAVLVPLVSGLLIFLGLLWTTTGVSPAPEWLPEQLWTPPWKSFTGS